MSEQIKQWFGIDVSQDHLDIAIHPLGNSFRVTRYDAGHSKLEHRLSAYAVEGIVLEATGGLERSFMLALESAGYPTRRVNPLQIHLFLPKPQANWQKQMAMMPR